MSLRYVKNTTGRGVILADRIALASISEKEALQQTIKHLQSRIDTLENRIAVLEKGKKE